jgi:glutathione synthase/RimK-type ligase-like ATP-grasp enzyme
MILVLTNSTDVTADYLCGVLQANRLLVMRFNTDTILSDTSLHFDLDDCSFSVHGVLFGPKDVSHVWYRRPERLAASSTENSPQHRYSIDEWTEALEGVLHHVPKNRWMNHPSCNAAASRKLWQLTLARSHGLTVPDTLVTQDPIRLRGFYQRHDGRIIAKPMAGGLVHEADPDREAVIYTNRIQVQQLDDLSDLPTCPVLFQKYIDKVADVRITVVDGDYHAVNMIAQDEAGRQLCDVRRNNMENVAYSPVAIPPSIREGLAQLVSHYQLRFAAIDMVIAQDGAWHFLEINPNGQWAWLDLTAHTHIADSFVRAFSQKD